MPTDCTPNAARSKKYILGVKWETIENKLHYKYTLLRYYNIER